MKKYVCAAVLAALMMASCANQAPPSGGPEDKTPPKVSAQFPENGQVNVDTRAVVEIRFSEWLNRASAAGAVSVYPAVPQGVAVRVKKNTLTVAPKAPLAANTTYHVSISAALQDLHGNAVGKPIDIIFSTGAALDSGRLDGAVASLKPKTAVQRVMLFLVDSGGGVNKGNDNRDIDSGGINQGDNQDSNDGGINQGNDNDGGWTDARYFSPPDYAAQTDSAGAFAFSHIKEGRYRMVAFADQYRTGKLRVGDTCFTSLDKIITVTKSPQTIRLYPSDADTVTAKKKTAVDSVSIDTISIDTAGIDTSKTKLAVDTVSIDTSKKKLAVDTARIDTSKKKAGVDTVSIDTSKKKLAVDTAGIDTSKTKLAVDTAGIDAAAGKSKRKRPADADSVCIRLSGGAPCLPPDEKRKWVYRPVSRRDTSFTVADSAGTFAFDSIPASKGTLLWFIDDNDDNLITPGRLSPWRRPEPFFVLPDTVEAKARWVVEGLNVRACEPSK